MNTSLDILAFAAHPDDAELGCGGSLILAAEKGLKVGIADLSVGEMSSRGTIEKRKAEAMKASELMGLADRRFVGLPDSQIGSEPAHQLPIIQLVRETRPRVVLAPYWEDKHPDHAATGRLVRDACFLAGVSRISDGRPHRPTRICYYMLSHPFNPSFVVDISVVWGRKMAAVAAYESQFQPTDTGFKTAISQSGFMQFIEARAIWFGAMTGAAYAEAFYMPGPVPLRELPGTSDPGLVPDTLPPYSMY